MPPLGHWKQNHCWIIPCGVNYTNQVSSHVLQRISQNGVHFTDASNSIFNLAFCPWRFNQHRYRKCHGVDQAKSPHQNQWWSHLLTQICDSWSNIFTTFNTIALYHSCNACALFSIIHQWCTAYRIYVRFLCNVLDDDCEGPTNGILYYICNTKPKT